MIFLLSLNAFAADNWDLLRIMQEKQAVLSQPILLGTTNAETKNASDFIQRIDPTLRIQSQPLPVIGDIDAEINRALAQNKLSCAIVLRLENDDWQLTEHGDCTSPDPTLSLNESEDTWTVMRSERAIPAMEWAVLTQDRDLHELLLEEQKKQLTIQRGLLIGSGVMAVSSIAPLQGIQPGGGSATEDRLWTSAFLLGSAWMIYKAAKYPAQKIAADQNDLSNYISKPYASATIKSLFSPEEDSVSEKQIETAGSLEADSKKEASPDATDVETPSQDSSQELPPLEPEPQTSKETASPEPASPEAPEQNGSEENATEESETEGQPPSPPAEEAP